MKNTSGKLGLIACVSLIMGNMIGSGIFLLPTSLAQYGSISFIGWLISTCGALLLAFVFSSLSRAHPATGGPYAYSKAMLGNYIGYQVAVCYWLSAMCSVAAMLVAFSSYLSAFIPVLKEHRLLSFATSTSLLWLITLMNLTGIKSVKFAQVATTVIKVVPLVLIVVFGIFKIKFEYLQAFNVSHYSNFSAATMSAILTTWALMGLESATVPAEHVVNPHRTIPLATYIGTLFTALVYIACSLVMLGIMPVELLQSSTSPFVDAGRILFGSWGGTAIGIVALISAGSACIGWVLIQSEIPLACARDGLFPSVFRQINRHKMPAIAMVFSSVIVTIIMTLTVSDKLVDDFTLLVQYSALGYMLSLLFTAVAALMTFLRDDHQSPTLFVKIILGLLATGYMIWMIAGSDYEHVYYLFMLLLFSAPAYPLIQWWNGRSHHVKEEKAA